MVMKLRLRRRVVAWDVVIALGLACCAVRAASAEEGARADPLSFNAGTDFTSHYVAYGKDVWRGGSHASPFSDQSTNFNWGTVTYQLDPHWSLYGNVWGDFNDNADTTLGKPIQEIDLNAGAIYTLDPFSFRLEDGYWIYSGDHESVLDFVASYDDAGKVIPNLSLKPSVEVHWRYERVGGTHEGVVLQPALRPTFVLQRGSRYPITIELPAAIGFFTGNFHGGGAGLGYARAGVSAWVPLAFVPKECGAWSAGATVTFWHTPLDTNPGNPQRNFISTMLSLRVGF
jgi:hypothetical protein